MATGSKKRASGYPGGQVARAALPIALVLIAPMAMLYPIWSNPLSAGEDDVVYYYPLRKMVGRAIRAGRLPLYNPLEATGTPLMADPQSAVMYPPTWLFAVTDPKLAYSLSIFLAFSLAGGGAYLYLRRLGLMRAAASVGAVAFMFCGFMVGHRVHLAMIHTACYLPWGLWCIEGLRGLDGPRRLGCAIRVLLWLTPIAYLATTSGHWPMLVYVGMIWAAYFLLRGRPLLPAAAVTLAGLLLAAALAWPQLVMTADLMAAVTRQRIGYATAGENSFFPAAAVLALFPMIMGSRTPNVFPQEWWGPWHLCEMLGYVGLLTLVLAAVGIRRLYGRANSGPTGGRSVRELREVTRKWTWLAIASGLWMLGYYLPTYRLVHMLPVLSVVRCPARMVLALDMALATLAAIAVHVVAAGDDEHGPAGMMAKSVRRGATIWLPLVMLATWGLLAAAGRLLGRVWPGRIPFLSGGAADISNAVRLSSPAVWVPLLLTVATGLAVRFWLCRAARRVAVLTLLLLLDLFVITRFVDVPPAGTVVPDPEISPAAKWLKDRAADPSTYRVWGLASSYYDRPAELLLPKVCQSLGLATIASYGPFQSPAHSQLLEFRIFGNCRAWRRLVRRNCLLSLYGVRYIVAAEPEFRDVIESVKIPTVPLPADGPNLLAGRWLLTGAEADEGVVRLGSPFLWRRSVASQPVMLQPGGVYRIALDARGPEAGAANFLRAEVVWPCRSGTWMTSDRAGLTVFSEQISPQWRHFEWTFELPADGLPGAGFQVYTTSERPIEVSGISLRASDWPRPVGYAGRLEPGQEVYHRVALLPARRQGDPPVAIYENRLWRAGQAARSVPSGRPVDGDAIERLKWQHDQGGWPAGPPIELAIGPLQVGGGLWRLAAPPAVAGAVYLLLAGVGLVRAAKSRTPT